MGLGGAGDAEPPAGLSVDLIGGTSTCCTALLAWIWALILAAAAAVTELAMHLKKDLVYKPALAAASSPFFLGSATGLPEPLGMGLLLRLDSDFLAGGERERRSNLEVRFGSGSFWSNRERFAERRSVSSIMCVDFPLVCCE